MRDKIIKIISREPTSIIDIANNLECGMKEVVNVLDELIKEDKNIIEEPLNTFYLCKKVFPMENIHKTEWKGQELIRFGVVSDTHLCNKWQQLTFLNHLYDVFESEGLETVYHAGDITDGYYKNRPGHVYEIFKVGADEQAEYVIEVYPKREGIVTKFITGNHDHTHIMNGGADIGKRIDRERDDMEYLGQANARVELTPNCILEVNHPIDGTAYAISYSIQKYMESLSGGDKPNILLNGHHHKALYLPYRNIHGFECGTTEAQTPWMKGKKIAAIMGGWIIEAFVDDEGTITRIKHEFIPLYRPLEDDY